MLLTLNGLDYNKMNTQFLKSIFTEQELIDLTKLISPCCSTGGTFNCTDVVNCLNFPTTLGNYILTIDPTGFNWITNPTTSIINTVVGNKIGDLVNENGILTPFYETITNVTDLRLNGNSLEIDFKSENGIVTTKSCDLSSILPVDTDTRLGNPHTGIGAALGFQRWYFDLINVISGSIATADFTYIDVPNVETLTTITDTIVGHKIGKYTNEGLTDVDINETITSISQDTSTGIISYLDETNTVTTANVVSTDPDNSIKVGSDGGSFMNLCNELSNTPSGIYDSTDELIAISNQIVPITADWQLWSSLSGNLQAPITGNDYEIYIEINGITYVGNNSGVNFGGHYGGIITVNDAVNWFNTQLITNGYTSMLGLDESNPLDPIIYVINSNTVLTTENIFIIIYDVINNSFIVKDFYTLFNTTVLAGQALGCKKVKLSQGNTTIPIPVISLGYNYELQHIKSKNIATFSNTPFTSSVYRLGGSTTQLASDWGNDTLLIGVSYNEPNNDYFINNKPMIFMEVLANGGGTNNKNSHSSEKPRSYYSHPVNIDGPLNRTATNYGGGTPTSLTTEWDVSNLTPFSDTIIKLDATKFYRASGFTLPIRKIDWSQDNGKNLKYSRSSGYLSPNGNGGIAVVGYKQLVRFRFGIIDPKDNRSVILGNPSPELVIAPKGGYFEQDDDYYWYDFTIKYA